METPPSSDDGRPEFDPEFATALVGKYVLVGVTVEDRRGETKRHEQFHGKGIEADPGRGIKLVLCGTREGERKWLPPATHVFEEAPRGTYTLRATGEKVIDPDYTAQWVLVQPDA
jgi:hypothetical protein